MAKVEISHVRGRWNVTVNGVELTNAIAAGGLRVDLSDEQIPRVHIEFLAEELAVRLDDAQVEAVRTALAGSEAGK